jgi:hypothetical protein
MATIAVDTLRLARGLEAAGFPTSQAQGAAEAIADAITEGVATRSDLREVELRLSGRIEETRLGVEKQLGETRLGLEKQLAETRLGLEKRLEETRLGLDSRIEETRLSLDKRIEGLRLSLEKQLEQTRLGLEARVATSQAELMRWMFGAVGLQVLAILGGVAALIKLVH